MNDGNKDETLIHLKNSDTGDISEMLVLVLEEAGYENRRIVQYSLALEEALLVWQNTFPADAEICIRRFESKKRSHLAIELAGEKCNPLYSDKDEGDYRRVRERIISGCGVEFSYKYKRNNNILNLTFPKEDYEAKLFRWNYLAVSRPIALQSLLFAVLSATTTIMLGIAGQDALAATSLVDDFVQLYNAIILAITFGAGVLTAQYWGSCDREAIQDILNIAIKIAIAISLVFFVVSFFFASYVMRFFTNDVVLLSIGAAYLKGISISFMMNAISQVYGCIMLNTGHAKKTATIAIISAILNLVLGVVLILGLFGVPSLGVTGAVIATNGAAGFWLICILREMVRDGAFTDTVRNMLHGKSKRRSEFYSQASGIFVKEFTWRLSAICIAALLGRMGSDVVAAKALVLMIANITLAFNRGLGQSAGIFIGNDLGRGQLIQAERKGKWIMNMAVKIGVISIFLTFAACYLCKLLPINLSEAAQSDFNFMVVIISLRAFFCVMNNVLVNGFIYAGGQAPALTKSDNLIMWIAVVGLASLLIYVVKAPFFLCVIVLFCDEPFTFVGKYRIYKGRRWLHNLT